MLLDSLEWAVPVDGEPDSCRTVVRQIGHDKTTNTTTFVASTADEDRTMWIVDQTSWRLADFRRNPVILDNHNRMRVVGKGTRATVPRVGEDAGQLMIDVLWDLDNPDPSIRSVGHQHLAGFRRAGSVGFKWGKRTERHKLPGDHWAHREQVEVEVWPGFTVKDSGYLFERNELREFSSATIPANAQALQRALQEADAVNRMLEAPVTELAGDVDGVPNAVRDDLVSMARALGEDARLDLCRLLLPTFEQLAAPPPSHPLPTLRGDGLDFLFLEA